jgi:hypothetical protein
MKIVNNERSTTNYNSIIGSAIISILIGIVVSLLLRK